MNEEIILNVESYNPYVIGAVAYVEQLENGAKITIVDKNGTTTATVEDGKDGKSISSIVLNDNYTLTINYEDGSSTTTGSIRGATGASGVFYGEEEPIDPAINVWVDPADGDGSVLKIRDEDDQWATIESIVGEPAGFGTVTATVDANHGTPAVTVTTSGDDTAKNFAFAFSNLQPAPYDDSELQADFAVLQGQFDTAVAAVTADTEVTDIRVGADGITDTTAGASVRRQFTDLKSDINNITGNTIISISEQGKYIDTSGSSVSMSGGLPVVSGSSATYSYALVACQAGDQFVINGTGGNQTRLWAFISSTGTVLEKSVGSASATNLLKTAPANSAFIVIHGKTAGWVDSYKNNLLITKVSELSYEADNVASNLKITDEYVWEKGSISNTTGANQTSTTRIRTKDYIPFDLYAVMNIGANVKYIPRIYSAKSADAFVWTPTTWGTPADNGATLGDIVSYYGVDPTNFKYVRWVLGNSDDSAVTDVNALGKKFTTTHFVVAKDLISIVNDEEIRLRSSVIGNCSIRCAKELSFTDGTAPLIEWFLLEEPVTGRFYYSKDLIEKKYLFTFPCKSYRYSFGILHNGDVIAVLDADAIASETKSDSNRENPYVFLASENWSVCHEVEFGANMKPCGWLSNCGYKVLADGSAIFCEYTRQTTETSNVWKLSGDPTDYSNWVLTKSFEITSTDNQTNFKHCHMVQQDFYTGKCYLSTGDDSVGAMMWYSDDNGSTWTQLRSPDSTGGQDSHGWYQGSQMYCRMLTLAFTEDYIYWATDTYINDIHYLFRVERDANGVFDYSTVELLTQIPYANGAATYGVALIPELNSILLLDRTDTSENSMPVRMITLDDNELHTIGTLYKEPYTASPKHLGFRTRFSEWYPIDGVIRFGFGLHVNHYNDDVNHSRGFGNMGSPEKEGVQTVNNLVMRVRRDGSDYRFTLNTFNI